MNEHTGVFSQLLLGWTAAQPGVTHVLAGKRNLAHVTQNAKAGELNLEIADVARIRKDVIALGETLNTKPPARRNERRGPWMYSEHWPSIATAHFIPLILG